MIQELIEIQERFNSFLKDTDYTFIGPENTDLLEPFMRRANNLAPIVGFSRELRHFLNNKQTAIQALDVLPAGTRLRIYVVDGTHEDDMLIHDTIENYCTRYNINFEI